MSDIYNKSTAAHEADPDRTAFRAGWPAWLGIAGSVWLILAPFVLLYTDNITALANSLIVGTIGFISSSFCAYMANRDHDKTARIVAGWLLAACGIWLILTPFVLDYSSVPEAFSNNLITGVLFVIISLYGLFYHSKRFDKAIKADPV